MVHATTNETADLLTLDLDWRELEVAKLLPGYGYSGRLKRHTVHRTWASMVQLRALFGADFTYDERVLEWVAEDRRVRIDPALAWRTVTEHDRLQSLYPFQNAGLEFMLASGSGLLGDELGCGKTPQALAFLQEAQALPAVVMCPNSVKVHWERRVSRWCPDGTPYVLDGTITRRRATLASARTDPSAVVIVNYEGVRALSKLAAYGSTRLRRCQLCDPKYGEDLKVSQCQVHPKELNSFGFRAAIMDEIHRCGDPTSQTTRAVWAVAHDPSVSYRWGLTGTPDNMTRLWSIMHTVQPDEYPTRSKFMDRYALTAWNAFGGSDVIGIRPDTREELFKILDPRFRRMIKSVVLPQLPRIVREVRYAELPPAQRKAYNALETQLFTELPNGQTLIAQSKLVAKTRLSQFAAGAISVEKPDEDDVGSWRVCVGFPSAKIDVLDEVLDELGDEPFVVACELVDLARMASERLADRGVRHQLVAGDVHSSTIAQATEDLASGVLRAIVFTHKKGGTGLDMSGAGTMIKLQRSWSLIEEIQSEGRVHRIGSERHKVVRIIDIVTKDTRDEQQIEALHRKFEQYEEITRDRAQLEDSLRDLRSDSKEFQQLVLKLNNLNEQLDQLFATYDLEEIRSLGGNAS